MLYKAASSIIYLRKRIVSKLYTDTHYYHSGCRPNNDRKTQYQSKALTIEYAFLSAKNKKSSKQ